MRTASDVARRIMWDPAVDRADFVVGYLDRFRGVLEKNFEDFNWGKLEMAGHFDLAIPEHRIQYFKYRGYVVWEKATRIDRIFGSTPPYEKISDVQAQMEEGKIRVAGVVVGAAVPQHGGNADDSDRDSDIEDELKLNEAEEDGVQPAARGYVNDRPNYFVSFKINDPTSVARLEDVQREVVRKDPRLAGACLPSVCFHVTLVTLQLRNEDEIEAAKHALAEAKQLLRIYVPRDVRLSIAGLECFRRRVLHACVGEHGRLQAFVQALKQVLRKYHVRLVGNHEPFTPHVTLVKLNREMCRNLVSEIDTHLWDAMRGLQFGLQAVEAMQLCKMTATEKDKVTGFYRCIGTVANTLPPATVHHAAAIKRVVDASSKVQVLLIVRGVPGAGKSTLTSQIIEALQAAGISHVVASADHYFMKDGVYQYRQDEIQAAHDACRRTAEKALSDGVQAVIVDNTNTQLVAYERYLAAAQLHGAGQLVLECFCGSEAQVVEFCQRGVHNVDPAACISMWQRWQPDPNAVVVRPSRLASGETEIFERRLAAAADQLNALYLGLFLTEESQQLLVSKVPPKYPIAKAHHVTLRFRPSVEHMAAAPLGQECLITVRTVASDGYCQSAVVELDQELVAQCAADDCIPHITVSHVKAVKPVYSLEMLLKTPGSEVLGGEFQLTGVVGALVRVGDGNPMPVTAVCDLEALVDRCLSSSSGSHSGAAHAIRQLLPPQLPLHVVEHLYVFDFDNTLIQTPSRRDYEAVHGRKWQGRGWWAHPDSLDDVLPLSVASGMQLLLEKAGQPRSATIILTGRVAPLEAGVRRVLQRFGIENLIDAVICKPLDATTTAEYKRETMRQLLQLMPAVKTATVWDDDADNMVEMSHLQDAFPTCKLEIFSCLHMSQAGAFHLQSKTVAPQHAGVLQQWAVENHLLHAAVHNEALDRTLALVTDAWCEVHPAASELAAPPYRVYGSAAYGRQSDVDIVLAAAAGADKKELLQRLASKLEVATRSSSVEVWTYFANSNRCPRVNALFTFDDLPPVDLDIVVTDHDLHELESVDLARHPELLGLWHLEHVKAKLGDALPIEDFGALLCAVCRVFEQAHALHAPFIASVRTFQIAQLLADLIEESGGALASAPRHGDTTFHLFVQFVQRMASKSIAQWRQLMPPDLVADCHLPRIVSAFQTCEQLLQTMTTPTVEAVARVLQPPLVYPPSHTGRVTISLTAALGASSGETQVFQLYNSVTGLLHKYLPRITGEGVSVAPGPYHRRWAFKRPIMFFFQACGSHIAEIVRRHLDAFVQDAYANGYTGLRVQIA